MLTETFAASKNTPGKYLFISVFVQRGIYLINVNIEASRPFRQIF